MSEIETEIKDTYLEHSYHNEFNKDCSECFKEENADKERQEVCETCGGTGEVSCMESVYAGEPYMASVGIERCPDCNMPDYDDIDMTDEY
jgi:DnaJ-class molecular chaperone